MRCFHWSDIPNLALSSLGLALMLMVAGCAIHPLSEDYSGVPTRNIVRQIRCETREAGINAIIGFLVHPANLRNGKVNSASLKVGLYYEKNPKEIQKFRPDMLSGAARSIVQLMWDMGVAYNYNLEMNELNKNSGGLNLLNTLPTSARSLGFGARLELERQNTRIFTIADTLGSVLSTTDDIYCSQRFVKEENFAYPLAGKIGILPVIQEFVLMSIFDNLSGDRVEDFSKPKGPVQLAEQLEFTTTIELSASPKVTFSPAGTGLHVAEASFSATSTRKDLHKLTLGLFVPSATRLDEIRGGVLGSLASPFVGTLASAPARNAGEEGALAVLNQALALRLLQTRIQVVNP